MQITYDAQGNQVNYLGHTLTWEKGRQLKSFDGISYTYNANGIRTSKTVDGVRHDYLLDGVNILKETWNNNALETLFDNEDSVCGIVYNGIPYYFLKNLQGDIIAIADANGEVVARYTYDAWGKCEISVNSTHAAIAEINPYRYRSYYFDTETGFYYLQSRYYDPTVGRFTTGDTLTYLGVGNSVACYDLYAYCENNNVNFVDYFGHAPSLLTLTRMHNAVVSSVQVFLLSLGVLANSEVRTCNRAGVYVGRMDVYSYIANRVWEVKRNNRAGIKAGLSQLSQYTSSYVYSLYHLRNRKKVIPRYGNRYVYGAVVVSDYLVTYRSYALNNALVVYDYMTLKKASELLFAALTASSAALAKKMARFSTKVKQKIGNILVSIKKAIGSIAGFGKQFINSIGKFLKKAGPVILAIIAIIIFMYTGVYVPA